MVCGGSRTRSQKQGPALISVMHTLHTPVPPELVTRVGDVWGGRWHTGEQLQSNACRMVPSRRDLN